MLREWVPDDLAPFAELNADPRVMQYYPAPLTRVQSDAFVRERIVPRFAERGFGLWAVEVPDVAPFVGYVGLDVPRFEADFTPCLEIGWRLAFTHWGKGYATEAARVAIAFGFAEADLEEVVSFTVPANHRSVACGCRELGSRPVVRASSRRRWVDSYERCGQSILSARPSECVHLRSTYEVHARARVPDCAEFGKGG